MKDARGERRVTVAFGQDQRLCKVQDLPGEGGRGRRGRHDAGAVRQAIITARDVGVRLLSSMGEKANSLGVPYI